MALGTARVYISPGATAKVSTSPGATNLVSCDSQ